MSQGASAPSQPETPRPQLEAQAKVKAKEQPGQEAAAEREQMLRPPQLSSPPPPNAPPPSHTLPAPTQRPHRSHSRRHIPRQRSTVHS